MRLSFFSRRMVYLFRKTTGSRITTNCFSSKVLLGEDTIFALSSGHGKAGVAVIRVSGPSAGKALIKLGAGNKLPSPRQASLRKILDPDTLEQIDKGLILWFPGPQSFTGEDCAELHVHGGVAVVSAVLGVLGHLPGLRHAEAGEFTKRAFMNGKLDLTAVEGLADLISAETEAQRKQALRQLDGDLSRIYTDWRGRLIKCLANVEAYIDFHEEENIEEDVLDHVDSGVQRLLSEISAHLNDSRRGERLRNGVHVVIIGQPNVGKSSLLNCVCQRPAAIVSSTAGTTRDVVETAINLAGYPVLLSDTAGLREAESDVELEGIRRAMSRALNSDIKVIMLDAPAILKKHQNSMSALQKVVTSHLLELGFHVEMQDEHGKCSVVIDTDEDPNYYTQTQSGDDVFLKTDEIIIVFNKCDLLENSEVFRGSTLRFSAVWLSCVTGKGISEFANLLTQKVKQMCWDPQTGNPSLTQARHRTHLTNCVGHLESYKSMSETDIVLAAQQLRKATREIGKVIGKVSSEDILNVIFSDFCIGK
ncbi:tRNA modification GTPase GTPBP3, mitochondrial-like [Gigantopelta aegis]|uniref:tRNA modification GTPase GTPBP3, mitochondrial-like n=1 Tax=Gigantopelta aegis TaxID=1735272 RepID=UPI001B88C3D8|nr:tRNA modification GTPase GTPBP3, mitochondrial-like [Gigantopelta aegis]XP_041366579.1 tRNA modification GTPase GTPBP3, mitochondrial-like [Gigantopelta aegis]XP_041366586.1 tRNA modification GTPase GTPBP3, mitochondrial-like [Gigantopelta aegis]